MKTFKLLLLATLLISGTTLSFAQTNKSLEKQAIAASNNIAGSAKDGVSTVYNDSKDGVKEIYSQIRSASPKAASIISSMADKLEVGVDSVWKILVRQQLVWSICFLILTISSIINWYAFYNKYITIKFDAATAIIGKRIVPITISNPEFDEAYYTANKKYLGSTYSSDKERVNHISFKKSIAHELEEDYIMAPPVTAGFSSFKYLHLIICIGLSLLSIYHFSTMLTGFINPEFGAMKNIMEFAVTLK
jgi:hypothetical protein